MRTIETVGIMYAAKDREFPTLRDACAAENGPNPYMLDMETFGAWRVIANDPRGWMYGDDDREAMDETNYAAIVEGLYGDALDIIDGRRIGENDEYLNLDTADYVTRERVLLLNPAGPNYEDNAAHALDCLHALADYPLLDEDAYSAREWEAWQEYAPEAWRDELRDAAAAERYDADMMDALYFVDADAILSHLSAGLHYSGGFSGDYAPNFLDIMDAWRGENVPDYYTRDAAAVVALVEAAGIAYRAIPAQ